MTRMTLHRIALPCIETPYFFLQQSRLKYMQGGRVAMVVHCVAWFVHELERSVRDNAIAWDYFASSASKYLRLIV